MEILPKIWAVIWWLLKMSFFVSVILICAPIAIAGFIFLLLVGSGKLHVD